MYVTVFSGDDFGFFHAGEEGFGVFAGVKELSIGFVAMDQLYPLDEVFFQHGVGNTADGNFVSTVYFFCDGDMFFFGGVGGLFCHKDHRFVTANKCSHSGIKNFDNVPAFFAFVDL